MKEIVYNIDDRITSSLVSKYDVQRMIISFILSYSLNNNIKRIVTNSSICSFLQDGRIYTPCEIKFENELFLHVGKINNLELFIDLTLNHDDKIIKLLPDARKNKIKLLLDEETQDGILIKFIDNYNIL